MLPNNSYLMNVGKLRYIQSLCESAEYRNPDALVGTFLSIPQRLDCVVRGTLLRPRLRANPFYHYLLARTRYYDEVFLDAVGSGVGCIINIGCGSDTRAYRFASLLKQKSVTVLECDQPEAIRVKRNIAARHWPTDHIRYLALNLEDARCMRLLEESMAGPALVMMEGVSPYIRSGAFEAFLRLLAGKLHPGSFLAYDFKIEGAAQGFFRLARDRNAVAAYHAALGLRLEHMELSAELTRRLLPRAALRFDEDCLLRLSK